MFHKSQKKKQCTLNKEVQHGALGREASMTKGVGTDLGPASPRQGELTWLSAIASRHSNLRAAHAVVLHGQGGPPGGAAGDFLGGG